MVNGRGTFSAAPVQRQPNNEARPSPTSADTDRTPSLHLGFSCVKKKRRREMCGEKKNTSRGRTDQAVSPLLVPIGNSVFFPLSAGNGEAEKQTAAHRRSLPIADCESRLFIRNAAFLSERLA